MQPLWVKLIVQQPTHNEHIYTQNAAQELTSFNEQFILCLLHNTTLPPLNTVHNHKNSINKFELFNIV
jgi:hypothetical protein